MHINLNRLSASFPKVQQVEILTWNNAKKMIKIQFQTNHDYNDHADFNIRKYERNSAIPFNEIHNSEIPFWESLNRHLFSLFNSESKDLQRLKVKMSWEWWVEITKRHNLDITVNHKQSLKNLGELVRNVEISNYRNISKMVKMRRYLRDIINVGG